jgi:hypothetical protein
MKPLDRPVLLAEIRTGCLSYTSLESPTISPAFSVLPPYRVSLVGWNVANYFNLSFIKGHMCRRGKAIRKSVRHAKTSVYHIM